MSWQRFFVCVLWIFGSETLFGQVSVYVSDKENNPIAGAVVSVSDLASGKKGFYITDDHGRTSVTVSPPFQASIRHLSFDHYTDTIYNSTDQTIVLSYSENNLDEIVVTGNFLPQSSKNSVYKVQTINANRIRSQGANSLQEVLSNELNIRFSRDNAIGTSSMSLQGLSGQNVKVLVDGIPIIGRSGTANEIDLNQININTIQQIEIVEGPLSVNYGADALAGVINIITRKDITGNLTLDIGLQEETVGREFSYFKDGIHNSDINIGFRPGSHFYSQLNTRINRFGGWTGTGEGRDKNWYPKTQYFAGGLLRYEKRDLSITYKLDYLNEIIENLGEINDNNPLRDAFAIDEEYTATRWLHQFQGSFSLKNALLNPVIAFTDYERTIRQFSKNMVTGSELNTVDSEQDTTYYRTLFFRNTLSNFLGWKAGKIKGDNQLGIDSNLEFAGGTRLDSEDESLFDIGLFISSEIGTSKLKIRPGIRFSYHSVYSTSPTPSINAKYDINNSTQLRVGYGRGYRAPSARELYFEFIDASHNILGNESLEPEYSHNVNADLTYKLQKIPVSLSIGGFYNHIDNRITFFTPQQANQATTYVNLLKYKTTGGSLRVKYFMESLTLNSGFSYVGLYQQLNETDREVVPQFLFMPEIMGNADYDIGSGFSVAAFYKYTGPVKDYQLVTDIDGEDTPQLTRIDGYQFLDVTFSKQWKLGISTQIGIRNAFDVTTVTNTTGGSVHGGSSQRAIAYGRSYFLKLNYHFSKP